jgi:hypothetical protein
VCGVCVCVYVWGTICFLAIGTAQHNPFVHTPHYFDTAYACALLVILSALVVGALHGFDCVCAVQGTSLTSYEHMPASRRSTARPPLSPVEAESLSARAQSDLAKLEEIQKAIKREKAALKRSGVPSSTVALNQLLKQPV